MVRREQTSDREWPVFPIGPILERYGGEVPMEDRGWHPYKCPFHGDRTASASVNTIINVFKCHSCEMKGNAVQLIMKQEGKLYGDALVIAEKATRASGHDLPKPSGRGRGVSDRSGNRSGSRAFKRTWRST